MGVRLVQIVEQVRNRADGLPGVDLARLTLKVGKALSRLAATLADDPHIVELAEQAAREILSTGAAR